MIGRELLELGLIPDKPENSELLNVFTEGNIDCLELLARNTQLDEDFVSDGDSSEVQLLDIRGEISNFVDELVGNVRLVL